MGDWHLLGRLLDKVQSHSTIIGKVWLTVLFVFRILVLNTATERVWGDEQSDFTCNTEQPGCENVCYDDAFPISHVRLWVLQIVAVATPKLLYLGYVLHVIHAEKKSMEKQIGFDERTYKLPKYTKSSGKISIHGRLLSSYILHLIASIVLEALFIWGQYYLYGLTLDTRYICHRFPCPHKVDCFLSRPTEKSIFIWFMLVAAIISLLLCLIEFFYMCFKVVKECVSRRQDYTVTPVTPPLKAYKSHDEMIQNCVNLDLETQARTTSGGAMNEGARNAENIKTGQIFI
ncbi:unnamed protein product [Knipowitschia caucasica]